MAVDQYCQQAVKSKEVQMDKGKVLEYVEGADQSLPSSRNPGSMKKWQQSQRESLSQQKSDGK